jgi:hypothetical protein
MIETKYKLIHDLLLDLEAGQELCLNVAICSSESPVSNTWS